MPLPSPPILKSVLVGLVPGVPYLYIRYRRDLPEPFRQRRFHAILKNLGIYLRLFGFDDKQDLVMDASSDPDLVLVIPDERPKVAESHFQHSRTSALDRRVGTDS